jgi:hypothetical protein
MTNEDLKRIANLNDDSLPAARKSLEETHGMIAAIPLDKRRESYRYDIFDKPLSFGNDGPPGHAGPALGLVRIPPEVVFRGDPSLKKEDRVLATCTITGETSA